MAAILKLKELLQERALKYGDFQLASGATSNVFIDVKQVALSATGHHILGDALRDVICRLGPYPSAVAGVELGGCPLASAVSLHSFHQHCGAPIDALYVRKSPKDHGRVVGVEGADYLPRNAPVAVVEDVVTTGASTARAIERLRDRGLYVTAVASVIDREQGGAQRFDVPFEALFTMREVVE